MNQTLPSPLTASALVCPLCNANLIDLSSDFNDSFSEYLCPTNFKDNIVLNYNTIPDVSHYYKIKSAQITTIILPPFIIASSANKTIVHLIDKGRLSNLAELEPIDPFNSIQINDIFTRFKNLLAFL